MSKPFSRLLGATFPTKLSLALIASYCLLNSVSVPVPSSFKSQAWRFEQAALAQRSGGRSRGGSFNRAPSRPSRSSGGSSGGSRGGGVAPARPGYGGYGYGGGYGGYGGYGYGSSVGGGLFSLVALLAVGGVGLVLWYLIWANRGKKFAGSTELTNDIVTVSKIQVALLAQGKAIQTQLAKIVETADLDTPEGRQHHVQEAALALLRMPENWSHVQAASETVKSLNEGETLFEKWSILERTKYTEETLTNVGGTITRKDYSINPEKDPASYIVVTLLVGTADDQPLFQEVRTSEALKEVLTKISSLSPDYLMIFEVLWTPQAEGDSLTYDELLTEYSDMLQI
ncbi:DUF1517 domain-containing protein [Myxacorys almedinensis]|uniref:DUF1517 domain-containing protein n=1 Tax=Myxacorys almedinensis A TaxID=2690445 RepID=A0A8J7YWF1_9CYAN|nr:DUF1517 domain-containing protein [Myxacorys almedinensis]NDJ15877.1 DUF1517 domain-containing protein [Myxacorys almedinensis A]